MIIDLDLAYTANAAEWSYTLMGFLCFCITVVLTRRAVLRRHFLRNSGENGGKMELATLRVQDRTISTIVQGGATLLGIYFMLTPPANPNIPLTTGGVVLAIYLLAVEALLLLKTINGYVRETRAGRNMD